MREARLVGRVHRVTNHNQATKMYHTHGENLLLERDKATRMNEIWVGDVTYLKVKGKWLYLATVMDQYSRRIIGWSLGKRRTQELTLAAMKLAIKKRGCAQGLIFHTDRGVEYTGKKYQEYLSNHEILHSVNRAGHCTDNAFMETFYHTLKGELIRGSVYTDYRHLYKSLCGYINHFYNTIRLHSGLDYQSPIKYEQRMA